MTRRDVLAFVAGGAISASGAANERSAVLLHIKDGMEFVCVDQTISDFVVAWIGGSQIPMTVEWSPADGAS